MDTIEIIVTLIITFIYIIGCIACFHFNGGRNGKHFLSRLFPLAWIMLFRIVLPLIILLVIIAIAIAISIELSGSVTESEAEALLSQIISFGAVVIMIIYWWRLVHHIKILRQ